MQRDGKGRWVVAIAIIMILGAGLWLILNTNTRKVMLSLGGQIVYAQVADTDEARHRGLSGTSHLGEHEAMLFVFNTSGRWGMWMKDMRYSLDILWLDSSKRIIYKAESVSPDTYPRSFLPDKDAQYVVELPAGFVAKYHIGLGSVVGFSVRS